MNIFLLFLTTLFMIGYYVLYSPSQQVTNTTTEDVVRMSDLRAIAECVIGKENAMMNSEEYNDPCVERYKVSGEYVCANEKTDGTIVEVLCTEGEPEYNFIVSYSGSDILTVDDYGPMLDIIERYYQDKGTFGIYEKHKLLTASSSGNIEINSVIYGTDSGNTRLQGGELVYVMQYKIPWTQNDISDPEDPDTCVPPAVLMTIDGETVCAVPNPPSEPCNMDGYVLDADGNCVPLEQSDCDDLKRICIKTCKDAGKPEDCLFPDCDTMTCIEHFDCPSGTSQIVLSAEEYEECIQERTEEDCRCVSNITNDEPTVQCGDAPIYTAHEIIGHSAGVTMQNSSLHSVCGPCEKVNGKKYNPNLEVWEPVCVPDISKIDSPACNDTELRPGCTSLSECCHDDNRGLYFGFPAGTNDIQCVDIGDYGQRPIAQLFISVLTSFLLSAPIEHQDGKWHCLECPNGMGSFFSNGASFWPWAATCNP